jgi:hypothetical protein
VLTFKYKLTTTTTIIVVVVVSCSSPLSLAPHRCLSSLVIGLYRLCPFMGTGRRLWAVVGDGCGPWWLCGSGYGRAVVVFILACLLSFPGGRPRFRVVIFDLGTLESMWWQHGHWSWPPCVVCGRGVVGVVVVLVEENKSHHKL